MKFTRERRATVALLATLRQRVTAVRQTSRFHTVTLEQYNRFHQLSGAHGEHPVLGATSPGRDLPRHDVVTTLGGVTGQTRHSAGHVLVVHRSERVTNLMDEGSRHDGVTQSLFTADLCQQDRVEAVVTGRYALRRHVPMHSLTDAAGPFAAGWYPSVSDDTATCSVSAVNSNNTNTNKDRMQGKLLHRTKLQTLNN